MAALQAQVARLEARLEALEHPGSDMDSAHRGLTNMEASLSTYADPLTQEQGKARKRVS